MKYNLAFDFTVNKESKTILVKREFDAGIDLVWKAWTTSELLDKWWAPAPYRNQTVTMDFREGGFWHYSMISPENEKHWARFDYTKIEPGRKITGFDGFCDEKGNIDTSFDSMNWENIFRKSEEITSVNITISFKSLESLEKIIAMGFREGFTMGLNQLDVLLKNLDNK